RHVVAVPRSRHRPRRRSLLEIAGPFRSWARRTDRRALRFELEQSRARDCARGRPAGGNGRRHARQRREPARFRRPLRPAAQQGQGQHRLVLDRPVHPPVRRRFHHRRRAPGQRRPHYRRARGLPPRRHQRHGTDQPRPARSRQPDLERAPLPGWVRAVLRHFVRADAGSGRAWRRLHSQAGRPRDDQLAPPRHARQHRHHLARRAAVGNGHLRVRAEPCRPRPHRQDLIMETRTLGHFIAGEWTGADGALESRNPSNTEDIVARFPNGGAAEVDQAGQAATEAFPGWANASPEVRADVLDKAANTIYARANQLGELLAREERKTRTESIGEALRAARIFRYFAGEALRRHGRTLESTRPGLDVATYREALGVVGLITPWNFPIAIPAWKAAPALAFGNTVVLKPANITPAIAVAL